MNFNMTFRKQAVFLSLLFCLLFSVSVKAEEGSKLPPGEILVVYSDGADLTAMKSVYSFVEMLTVQSFQVTFAPASECLGNLSNYKSIVLFEIMHYPRALIDELYPLEEAGRMTLENRGSSELVTTEDLRLLFVGNQFLKNYLDATGRSGLYRLSDRTVGKLNYQFNDYTSKEVLMRSDYLLFLKGEYDYQSGTVETEDESGYYCARKNILTHICGSDLDDALIKAALTRETAKWKWPYYGEPHTYAQYIVLDKVYPFQNPSKLLEVIKKMAALKEPFVISVMPVYANGDFPAMQQFCEILRYAQDNGGAVVIHSPINQMTEFDVDLVNDYMTKAVQIYLDQGVFPMGLMVPRNWMFNEAAIDVMSHFSTIFLSDEEDGTVLYDQKARTNSVYRDGHQWIAPAIVLDKEGTSYLKVHSTSVSIDISESMEDIVDVINACRNSFVPLKSLWDVDHSFWTNEDAMTCKKRMVMVNGKKADLTFNPAEYDKNYSYHRNMLQRFSKDLTGESSNLLILVVVVSLLFLIFIILARRNNRKRFFYKNEEDTKDEYWENKK